VWASPRSATGETAVSDQNHNQEIEVPRRPGSRWSPRTVLWETYARFRHPSWALAIRLLLCLAVLICSLYVGGTFVVWGVLGIFAVLIVPIGRTRSFFAAFVPYIGIWAIFTVIRALAGRTIIAKTLNTKVPSIERWIFGGQLPTVTLQDHFFTPLHLHWWDYAFTGVHWSYFLIPHIVAVRTWQKHPEFFKRYLMALGLTLSMGLAIYFLIPSNPPWMAPEIVESPSSPVVYRVMATVGEQIGGGIYRASYRVIGESNPIAAMPSLHMAGTFIVVFPALYAGKKWAIPAFIYSGLMGLALMYLGEHYFIDVTMGVVITTYGWIISGLWMNNVAPRARAALLPRQIRAAQPTPAPNPAPAPSG
jgi:hypothetical protein